VGVLYEILPQAGNRVTWADDVDQRGVPIARFDHSLSMSAGEVPMRAPPMRWV
jgi:hypothetical protein